MTDGKGILRRATFGLAALSTGLLIFNMAAVPLCRQQVFVEQETISRVEVVIGVGFALVVVFDIASVLWSLSVCRRRGVSGLTDAATVILGVLCPLLLFGEKVMVDEIAREYRLGWEVVGEWIILYVLMTVQLVYNLVILSRLRRIRPDTRSADEVPLSKPGGRVNGLAR